MGVVVVATLTLSHIASDEQKKLLEAESKVCPFISSNDITRNIGLQCKNGVTFDK